MPLQAHCNPCRSFEAAILQEHSLPMSHSPFSPALPTPISARSAIVDRDFIGRLFVGDRILDLGTLKLLGDFEKRITRKAAAVMIYLARNQERTVTRQELLDSVWTGTCPTPEVVAQVIMELRRLFDDADVADSMIETVPRLGYRLTLPVVFDDLPALRLAKDAMTAASAASAALTLAETGAASGPTQLRDQALSRPAIDEEARRALSASRQAIALLLIVIAMLLLVPKLWSSSASSATTIAPSFLGPPQVLIGATGTEYFPEFAPGAMSVVFSAPDPAAAGVFKLFERGVGSVRASRVTSDAVGEELMSALAPNGRLLAYVRIHSGNCEVRIMQIPGGTNRLAFPCSDDLTPYLDWSPDGSRLAAYGHEPGKPPGLRLFEYRLADGVVNWLTYPRKDSDMDVEPRYAPDGQTIAFRRRSPSGSELWLLDPVRGQLKPILSTPRSIGGFDWLDAPPRLIAALQEQGQGRLALIDLDGQITLSDVEATGYPPRVQGNRVVFSRGVLRSGVATMSVGERAVQRSFRAVSIGANSSPAYAPNAGAIAYASDHAGERQVWVLPRDSDTPTAMDLSFRGRIGSLTWSSDGTQLLFVVIAEQRAQLFRADVASKEVRLLPTGDVRPRNAAFDSAADVIWFSAEYQGRNRLYRMLQPSAANPHIVPTEISANEVQTRHGVAGVFVRDGCIVHLSSALAPLQKYCPSSDRISWRVGDQAIWIFRETGVRIANVQRFSLADAALADQGDYFFWWADGGFDVAPDEAEFLYSAYNSDESDIVIANLLRN